MILSFTNIFVFLFGQEFDIRVTLGGGTFSPFWDIFFGLLLWEVGVMGILVENSASFRNPSLTINIVTQQLKLTGVNGYLEDGTPSCTKYVSLMFSSVLMFTICFPSC